MKKGFMRKDTPDVRRADHRSLILPAVVGIGELDEAEAETPIETPTETETSRGAGEHETSLLDEPTADRRTSLQDICAASGYSSSDDTARRCHGDELTTAASPAAGAIVAPSRDVSEQCTADGGGCSSCDSCETAVGRDTGEASSADCKSILSELVESSAKDVAPLTDETDNRRHPTRRLTGINAGGLVVSQTTSTQSAHSVPPVGTSDDEDVVEPRPHSAGSDSVTGKDEQRKQLIKSLSDVVHPTFDPTASIDRPSQSVIDRSICTSHPHPHLHLHPQHQPHPHHKMKVLSRRDTPRVVGLNASVQRDFKQKLLHPEELKEPLCEELDENEVTEVAEAEEDVETDTVTDVADDVIRDNSQLSDRAPDDFQIEDNTNKFVSETQQSAAADRDTTEQHTIAELLQRKVSAAAVAAAAAVLSPEPPPLLMSASTTISGVSRESSTFTVESSHTTAAESNPTFDGTAVTNSSNLFSELQPTTSSVVSAVPVPVRKPGGARAVLIRKNTPAVLPKVESLYGSKNKGPQFKGSFCEDEEDLESGENRLTSVV